MKRSRAKAKAGKMLISLVVPVYNEQNAVAKFVETVSDIFKKIEDKNTLEIVFVDDGSSDATELAIQELIKSDDRICLISLSRNFGKEAALCAGLDHAKGDAVIPIDVDLQDPPEIIPEMIKKWSNGAQVVNAKRKDRSSDTFTKRQTARFFYKIFNWLAEQEIPADVGDFRLLDRQVVNVIKSMNERVRFNKAIFSWVGFRTDEIEFVRGERESGSSAWTYFRLWNFALDAIFSSSTKPLKVWTYLGFIISILSFIFAIYILFRTIILGVDVPGYASTVLLILSFGGLNLFAVGIIGEYVGRIFKEVRNRPLYIVRSTSGISIDVLEKDTHA